MSNPNLSSYPYVRGNSTMQVMDDRYVTELFKRETDLQEKKRLNNALYNPKTGYIHLEDPRFKPVSEYSERVEIPWDSYEKVINTKTYNDIMTRSAAGETRHINDDRLKYGFYTPAWQDLALRYNEEIESRGAGVITSTDFPAITVTTVSNELIRNELLVTQKYNLLGIGETINTDQLWVIYPEYNDTGKKVRSGYRENDPIDLVTPGAFTETRIGLEKAGVGIGFTEEYYMRQFNYPIQSFLMEAIANDFVREKHDRIIALLPSFANVTGASWSAFTAANPHSDNRPTTDLNNVKIAINGDKLARANILISRELQWADYDTNTWTNSFGQPVQASNVSQNDVITRPRGIPWATAWYLNEDVPADTVYILDERAFVKVQGPKKTTQAQLFNPDQTVFFQKDWFKQHLRKAAWGRELVSV